MTNEFLTIHALTHTRTVAAMVIPRLKILPGIVPTKRVWNVYNDPHTDALNRQASGWGF